MKNIFAFTLLTIILIIANSCGQTTNVVESGTYEGEIVEVEPDKTEIYVKTDDGKVLELYFTDETMLTRNGNSVDFSELSEGTRVEVEIEKEGQRLDPVSVKIL